LNQWLRDLKELSKADERCAIVTVVSVKGSTPREAGATMLVTVDRVLGTVGGGQLEYKAIESARRLLGAADPSNVQEFVLGAGLDQCCGGLANLWFESATADAAAWVEVLSAWLAAGTAGIIVSIAGGERASKILVSATQTWGRLTVVPWNEPAIETARSMLAMREAAPRTVSFGAAPETVVAVFEPVYPVEFPIRLFGAGHVGRALVNVLGGLPAEITWVDSRRSEFPALLPDNVTVACTSAPEREIDTAPAGSYFAVMTHSHALDLTLATRILRRGDFRYFGMMGSHTKRRTFAHRLAAAGIAPEALERMICPLGIDGINAKHPAAIAIAVAAQMLLVRELSVPASADR